MAAIITSEAKCRDCYKCIRHCLVKAISINNEQASVVQEECILCGRCVSACPQQAKSSSSAVDVFDECLNAGEKVAVSIAPSYLAAGRYSTPWKLLSVLRAIGVKWIEETAIGAGIIAREYNRLYQQNRQTYISSCCPTVVSLIKKKYPLLLNRLAPLRSPMLVHAELMRKNLGKDWKIVFIGPCYAKKEEPVWTGKEGAVDIVLDFEETLNYLAGKGLNPEGFTEAYPDKIAAAERQYPLERGILDTAGIKDSLLANIISISGLEQVQEVLEDLKNGMIEPGFIELTACYGGCIGGPAMANNLGISARKRRMSLFINDRETNSILQDTEDKSGTQDKSYTQQDNSATKDNRGGVELGLKHTEDSYQKTVPTEEEVREILALTGKFTPEDETNCGGCGYSSCREKAEAVYRGLARVEMCVPYMREKAESLSHAVVDSSLNGIIIVNENMLIQEFNPAANRMFNQRGIKTRERHLKDFIDPEDYQKVWQTKELITDRYKEYPAYDLITRENIYPLEKYGVVIGIITDVTAEEKNRAEVNYMKIEALEKAERVINEQMKTAQKIAGLLGESTAETKATLLQLIKIMNKKGVRPDGDQG